MSHPCGNAKKNFKGNIGVIFNNMVGFHLREVAGLRI